MAISIHLFLSYGANWFIYILMQLMHGETSGECDLQTRQGSGALSSLRGRLSSNLSLFHPLRFSISLCVDLEYGPPSFYRSFPSLLDRAMAHQSFIFDLL